MQFDQQALKQRGTALYNEFTAGQKAMVIVAAVGLLFGGLAFMRWAAAPSWAPLFTNLEASEAADVTTELDSMGVDYQLADGGSTIMVPRQDVYQTRLDLSAQGLPRVGGDGWNLIDEQGLTTSEFRQRVDFQRAMEGELARTIASIDAIDTATVHLVIPEDDLFSGDDVHASASVLVDAGSAGLSAGQVQAIVHLVSSSVEGMIPDYVTVADTDGRVLAAAGQDGVDLAAGEQQLARKTAYEASVANSIQALLEPVTGVGRTRVVVSADMDFDEKESFIESFGEADTAPVIAEDTSTENYINSTGEIVGGVLGPDAVPITDGGETGSEYTKEDVARTYAVDKITEQIRSAPGSVNRLSIAVLVDEAAGVNTADIADLVTAGAGLVPARGDSIEVTAMAFGELDVVDPTAGTSSSDSDEMMITLAQAGAVLLLVLLVLALAYRSARRSSLARYPVAIPLPSAAEDAATLLDDLAREIDRPARAELESAEPPRHVVLHNQIGELIDRQPEDVAAVLRTWLADRRG